MSVLKFRKSLILLTIGDDTIFDDSLFQNESNSSDQDNDIENLSPDKKIEYYSQKLIKAVEENPTPTKISLMIKSCNLNIHYKRQLSGSTSSR